MLSTMCSPALAEHGELRPVEDAPTLESRIGYQFVDRELVELALRHRSWCAENGAVESNERLEFLGDSVLGLVVTRQLFLSLPHLDEGLLARHRAELVNWRTLSDLAREIDLGSSIRLGRGEIATGGADKSSILADALEAVIGAVFLDAGLDAATSVVLGLLGERVDITDGDSFSDHKSRLQELAAATGRSVPEYRIKGEGPDHDRWYRAEVIVGEIHGEGAGRSKKQAEQGAAHVACLLLSGEADESSESSNHMNGADHG